MATFPRLKTGAVTQYPAATSVGFQNQVLQFVDGSEQRYRDARGPLRQWAVNLELLDEGEMAALDQFFLALEGAYGTFSFTDPDDSVEYATCSLATDQMAMEFQGEARGRTQMVIREERG